MGFLILSFGIRAQDLQHGRWYPHLEARWSNSEAEENLWSTIAILVRYSKTNWYEGQQIRANVPRRSERARRNIWVFAWRTSRRQSRRRNLIEDVPTRISSVRRNGSLGVGLQSRTIFCLSPDTCKLKDKYCVFHLEGKALQWFQWIDRSGVLDGWRDFTEALNAQFGPSGSDDPTGLLAKLWQSASVQDYQEEFESLATDPLFDGQWKFGSVMRCQKNSLPNMRVRCH